MTAKEFENKAGIKITSGIMPIKPRDPDEEHNDSKYAFRYYDRDERN